MSELKRPIRIEGDVAYVPLTRGYEAVIDAADVPLVNGVNWYAMVRRKADGAIKSVYALHKRKANENGRRETVSMHRVIANTPAGMETDHADGDGLNNRRANLRNATGMQNRQNVRIPTTNSSGAKGVSWHKGSKKWRAQIRSDGKKIYLGNFTSIEDAAAAYAAASAKMHGEFGRTA